MTPAGWSFTRGISARLVFVQGPVGSCVAWAEPKAERNTHEAILFALAEALAAAPEAETSASASGAASEPCKTCGGHGLVGHPLDYSMGCPECNPDETGERAPAAPVGDAELPPMPKPYFKGVQDGPIGTTPPLYTADQMQAYARAAQALAHQPGGEVAPLDEATERARFWAWARAKVSPGLMDAWIAAKRDAAQTAATLPSGEVRKPLTEAELRRVLQEVAEGIDSMNIVMTNWPLVARAVERALGIGTTTSDAGEQQGGSDADGG